MLLSKQKTMAIDGVEQMFPFFRMTSRSLKSKKFRLIQEDRYSHGTPLRRWLDRPKNYTFLMLCFALLISSTLSQPVPNRRSKSLNRSRNLLTNYYSSSPPLPPVATSSVIAAAPYLQTLNHRGEVMPPQSAPYPSAPGYKRQPRARTPNSGMVNAPSVAVSPSQMIVLSVYENVTGIICTLDASPIFMHMRSSGMPVGAMPSPSTLNFCLLDAKDILDIDPVHGALYMRQPLQYDDLSVFSAGGANSTTTTLSPMLPTTTSSPSPSSPGKSAMTAKPVRELEFRIKMEFAAGPKIIQKAKLKVVSRNDEPPGWSPIHKLPFDGIIPSNTTRGTTVFRLLAIDPDHEGKVMYELVRDLARGKLQLDRHTGHITTTTNDLKTGEVLLVTVRGRDVNGDANQITSEVNVTLTVEDINNVKVSSTVSPTTNTTSTPLTPPTTTTVRPVTSVVVASSSTVPPLPDEEPGLPAHLVVVDKVEFVQDYWRADAVENGPIYTNILQVKALSLVGSLVRYTLVNELVSSVSLLEPIMATQHSAVEILKPAIYEKLQSDVLKFFQIDTNIGLIETSRSLMDSDFGGQRRFYILEVRADAINEPGYDGLAAARRSLRADIGSISRSTPVSATCFVEIEIKLTSTDQSATSGAATGPRMNPGIVNNQQQQTSGGKGGLKPIDVHLAENAPADALVAVVEVPPELVEALATLPRSERIAFGFINGVNLTHASAYEINIDTGMIRVALPHLLRPDTHEQLEVFIGAESHFSLSDIGQLPNHHFQLINIWIDDLNNYPPIISNCKRLQHSPPKLLETASVDTIVAQIIARDHALDAGENAKLEFSLAHRNQGEFGRQLGIDPLTGFIRSTRTIDVDMLDNNMVEVVVSVRDNAYHPERSLISYCYFSVQIIDVNDNEPLFIHLGERTRLPAVETSIPVGATPGYKIYQLHAIDHDYSVVRGGKALAYRMARSRTSHSLLNLDNSRASAADNAASFHLIINRDTGWLMVRRTIEQPTMFEFVAEATDGVYTANVRMVIRVFDALIPPPAWFRREEVISVSEMAPAGTVLTMLSAGAGTGFSSAQALSGLENQVAYQILCAVPYYDHFALKPRISSGMNVAELVVAAEKLDYELAHQYNITVIARNARSPLVSRLFITVDVSDANDNFPQFLLPQLNVSVLEDAPVGAVIGVAYAVDADASRDMAQFRYTLELDAATGAGGSAREQDFLVRAKFSVDAISGEIHLRDQLDAEQQQQWQFDIVAHSGSSRTAKHKTRQKVLVQVVDVNDNVPIFDRENYTFYVNGSAAADTVVGKVQAIDLDFSASSPTSLQYMTSGCKQHLACPFRIEPRTGTIYTWRPLTVTEQDAVFETNVYVSDGAYSSAAFVEIAVNVAPSPAPTTAMQVIITMPPTQDTTTSTASTMTSAARTTTTVSPITATSVTMMPTDTSSVFAMNTFSPQTSLPPSRHQPTSHLLEPDFLEPDRFPTTSVVTATPEDPLEFPIQQIPSAHNSSAAGSLAPTPEPPLESSTGPMLVPHFTQNLYRVTVEEEIPAAQLPYMALHITVEYDQMSVAVPQERTLLVLPRTKTSPSKNSPQQKMAPFFFTDNQTALEFVRIVHDSGQILITRSIDYDPPNSIRRLEFPIFISQQDTQNFVSGVDQNQAQIYPMGEALAKAYVIIDIGDVNDNRPRWMTNHTEVVMRPLADVNAFIAEAYATDADSGRFGDISYEIISESPMNGTFAIDTKTGLITTNVCCLEEIGPVHELLITAVDGGGLSSNGPMRVIVRTRDGTTTNAPLTLPPVPTGLVLEGGASALTVKEDTLPGTVLTRMTLRNHDKQLGVPPTPVIVTVVPQDPYMRDVFEVKVENQIDVSLILKRKLDYEDPAQQEPLILFIVARHQNPSSTQRNETRTISITVQDINDNAPNFGSDLITIAIDESVDIDTVLVDLNATDWDKGGKATVRYALVSASDPTGRFHVDEISGVMRLVKPLDFETVRHYALVIKATDAESEPYPSTNITVDVFVEDVNDHAPTLIVLPLRASTTKPTESLIVFKENLPAGVETVEITAADADGTLVNGPPFRFAFPEYYAKSEDRMFELTARPDGAQGNGSAILSARALLDRERQALYLVPLLITDSGTPPLTSSLTLTVHVADVNDNPHTPFNKLIDIYRYVGQPDSFDIGHVMCSDADNIDGASVKSEGDPKSYKWNEHGLDRQTVQYFDLNESTGLVRASATLAEGDYSLSFVVSDQPFGAAVCNLTVSVHVIEDFLILNSASIQLLGSVDGDLLHSLRANQSPVQMVAVHNASAHAQKAAAVTANNATPNRLALPLFIRIKRAIARVTEAAESDVHIFGIREQQQHIQAQTPASTGAQPSAMVSIASAFAARRANDAAILKALQNELQPAAVSAATTFSHGRVQQPTTLSTVLTTTTDIRFTVVDAQQGMLVDPVRLHALVELNWAEIERDIGMRLLRTDLNYCPSMVVTTVSGSGNKLPIKVPACSVGRTCSRNLKVGASTLVEKLWSSFVVVNILPDEDCTCVNGAPLSPSMPPAPPMAPTSNEIARNSIQTSTCDELFCYNDGECTINPQTLSASCACSAALAGNNEFTGTHCQLVARGFTGASSFAWLPPLRPCATFSLSVEYRSPTHDGVILVAGIPPAAEQWQFQQNLALNGSTSRHGLKATSGTSRSDFLALHLTDSNRIVLTLTLADDVGELDVAAVTLAAMRINNKLSLSQQHEKRVNLGSSFLTTSIEAPSRSTRSRKVAGRSSNATADWERISIQINEREIILTSDDCTDRSASNTCYSRIALDAEKSALLGQRPLVLRGPLQLGGVPRSYARRYNFIPFLTRPFRGCLRHLTFNGEVFDMQSVAFHYATVPGCPRDIVEPHAAPVQQILQQPAAATKTKNSVEFMARSLSSGSPRARSGLSAAAASSLFPPLPTQQLPMAEDGTLYYTTNSAQSQSFINGHVLRQQPSTNSPPRPTGIITTVPTRQRQQQLPSVVPTLSGISLTANNNTAGGQRARTAQPPNERQQQPRTITDRGSVSTGGSNTAIGKQQQFARPSSKTKTTNPERKQSVAVSSPVFDGFQLPNDKKMLRAGLGGGGTEHNVPNSAPMKCCRGGSFVSLDSNALLIMIACLIFLWLVSVSSSRCLVFVVNDHGSSSIATDTEGRQQQTHDFTANGSTSSSLSSSTTLARRKNDAGSSFYYTRIFALTLYLGWWRQPPLPRASANTVVKNCDEKTLLR